MKKIYSLKGRNLFKEVYKKGTRLQEQGIRVFILECEKTEKIETSQTEIQKSQNPKKIKIGITVDKKFGKAYQRNRVKRRFRSICAELLLKMREGFCIIIRIERNFQISGFPDEKNILTSLFTHAGVLIREHD